MNVLYFLSLAVFFESALGYANYIPATSYTQYRQCGIAYSPLRTGSPQNVFHISYPSGLLSNVIAALPEAKPARSVFLTDGDIYFKFSCSGVMMTLSYLHEGAGYSNLFGYFTFILKTVGNQTRAVITNEVVIFPQVDSPNCMSSPNATSVTFGPFDTETYIGFYIIADGYNQPNFHKYRSVNNWGLRNPDGLPHMSVLVDAQYNKTIIGFEDLYNLGDKDYNDVLFVVNFSPACYSDSKFALWANGQVSKCNVGEPDITNILTYGSYDYALLDNTDPQSTTYGCQSNNRGLYLPSGWVIAPYDNITSQILSCNTWGANCLVMNGTSINPSSGATCFTSLLAQVSSGSSASCYSPSNCTVPSRVLIRRNSTSPYAPLPLCNYAKPATEITNFLTADGIRYALLDNGVLSSTGNGSLDLVYYYIPDGWEIVPSLDEVSSVVIGAKSFGTECIFLGDGNGYIPGGNGGTCTGLVQTATINGKTAVVVAAKKTSKILIRQKTTVASCCCCT